MCHRFCRFRCIMVYVQCHLGLWVPQGIQMIHVIDKWTHTLGILHVLGHTEYDVTIDLMIPIRGVRTTLLGRSREEHESIIWYYIIYSISFVTSPVHVEWHVCVALFQFSDSSHSRQSSHKLQWQWQQQCKSASSSLENCAHNTHIHLYILLYIF